MSSLWAIHYENPGLLDTTINAESFQHKDIYLTDARRVGVMLRDGRLSLRNHSALTRFTVETISQTDAILQTPHVEGDKAFVKVDNKGAFYAKASRDEAQKFQFRLSPLGIELYLAGQRPAVFDHEFDVSVGKWEVGRSPIPILVHENIWKIWLPQFHVGSGGGSGGNGA